MGWETNPLGKPEGASGIVHTEASSVCTGGILQFTTASAHWNQMKPRFAAPSSSRRRWLSLAVVCLAQLMIVLDTTIVNVALPAIQRDLHFTQGNLTWVVNAFLVTFGSFLLLAGRLADLFGRRRVFLAVVLVYTIASVVCGLAPVHAE